MLSCCKHVLVPTRRSLRSHRIEPTDYYKPHKLKLKQILDIPLDMLGLELALSAEAANADKHEAKQSGALFMDLI
jgi:hypothetical protein